MNKNSRPEPSPFSLCALAVFFLLLVDCILADDDSIHFEEKIPYNKNHLSSNEEGYNSEARYGGYHKFIGNHYYNRLPPPRTTRQTIPQPHRQLPVGVNPPQFDSSLQDSLQTLQQLQGSSSSQTGFQSGAQQGLSGQQFPFGQQGGQSFGQGSQSSGQGGQSFGQGGQSFGQGGQSLGQGSQPFGQGGQSFGQGGQSFGQGGQSFGQGGQPFGQGGQSFGQGGQSFGQGGQSFGQGGQSFGQGGQSFGQGGQSFGQGGQSLGQGGQPFGQGGQQGSGQQLGVTTQSPQEAACIARCNSTSQYNPVCGSDGVTYTNPNRLRCAQSCARSVEIQFYGICVTTTTQAPQFRRRP